MSGRIFDPLAATPQTGIATPATPQPAPMADTAFHGLAGQIVNKIAPHTEADRNAMLIQLLVAFGNCVGRGPHFRVEDTPHYANEFAVLVGKSAKARKGTSFNRICGPLEIADAEWQKQCHANGLVSGEGVVHAIRDDMRGKGGKIVPGVADKRLFIVEEELGGALAAAARKDNTLTAILRSSWDGKDLRTMGKISPVRVTAPHISLIGHITFDELKNKLRGDSLSNGFANRILWIYTKRARVLPLGGNLRSEDLRAEGEALRNAVAFARTIGELTRDDETSELWCEAYGWLSGERPGVVGEVTSRLEAHAVRLSLMYALLDGSPIIQLAHLEAALAVCKYALCSAEHCFGGLSPDALAIYTALSASHPGGLSRTEIGNRVFDKHITAERLTVALRELESAGHATPRKEDTGGAPRETWRVAEKAD